MRLFCAIFAVALLMPLQGCVTQPVGRESVEVAMLLPPAAKRHEQVVGSTFYMPELLPPGELPIFPAAESSEALVFPVSICVEIVISARGEVVSAGELQGVAACDGAGPNAPFLKQSLRAVRRWEFIAAGHCTWPDSRVEPVDCEADGGQVEAVPVRLAFRFDFESTGGRPEVSSYPLSQEP